jgi:hypothetical protein
LNWSLIVPLTIAYVLVIYFWESLCLVWLFSREVSPVSCGAALRARGSAYVGSAIHYVAGQGALAWLLSDGRSSFRSLALCMLVTFTDAVLLLVLGVVGGLLSPRPQGRQIALFCGLVLVAVVAVTFPAFRQPAAMARVIGRRSPAHWFQQLDWNWTRFGTLALWRSAQFGIVFAYIAAGLYACHSVTDMSVLGSVIPLALLCDGLPISVAGLGTRDTIFVALLEPSQPESLVAFTLIWTVGSIITRAAIGLANLWLFGLPRVVLSPSQQDAHQRVERQHDDKLRPK